LYLNLLLSRRNLDSLLQGGFIDVIQAVESRELMSSLAIRRLAESNLPDDLLRTIYFADATILVACSRVISFRVAFLPANGMVSFHAAVSQREQENR
jgi:hypothetical protein